jgi:hypothetical protein
MQVVGFWAGDDGSAGGGQGNGDQVQDFPRNKT